MRFSKLLVSMAPLACAFVAGATAVAFVAEANAAEPQQTSAGIVEEIVVTSRREEEQIQDVPVVGVGVHADRTFNASHRERWSTSTT